MGAADFYLPGSWNLCDDRTGFKVKSTWVAKQWDNVITDRKYWEPRHEQDFLRSIQDRQAVWDPRPDCEPHPFVVNAFEIDDDTGIPIIPAPALALVKTATPAVYSTLAEVISYSYLVTNTGNVTITSLVVTDDNADGAVSCPVSSLAAGVSTTCTAQHTVTQADLDNGTITNYASASGTDPDGGAVASLPDSETVTFEGDILTRIGCFQMPTETGNVDWTVDLDGKIPKAVQFVVCLSELDGTASANLGAAMGFTDGEFEYLGVVGAEQGAAIDTFRAMYDDKCVGIFEPTTFSLRQSATFVAFITNGVRLNFDLIPLTNAEEFYVTATFFAGDSCQAKAYTADINETEDVAVDVTGIGFEPDMVQCFQNISFAWDAGGGDCQFNYGVAHNNGSGTVTQRAMLWRDRDLTLNTNVLAALLSNRINGELGRKTTVLEYGIEASDFDSDGFSLTPRGGGSPDAGGPRKVIGLALKFNGKQSWVGVLDSPTSTGAWAQTGPAFTPQLVGLGLLAVPSIDTLVDDGDAGSFGFGTFDSSGAICSLAWADEDELQPSVNQSLSDTSKVINFTDDEGTQTFAATFTSVDANGWTLNFSVADGTTRKWLGWAVE